MSSRTWEYWTDSRKANVREDGSSRVEVVLDVRKISTVPEEVLEYQNGPPPPLTELQASLAGLGRTLMGSSRQVDELVVGVRGSCI